MKHWCIGIVLCCCMPELHAQDAYFTNFQVNPALSNVALTGSADSWSAFLQYRTPWSGVYRAPVTAGATVNYRHGAHAGGIITVIDRFGVTTESRISGQYAYRYALANSSINAGVAVDITQGVVALTNTQPAMSGDPLLQSDIRNTTADITCAAAWQNDRGYIGVQSGGLMRNSYYGETSEVPVIWKFLAAYRFTANPMWDITPGVLYAYVEGQPTLMILQAQLRWHDLLQLDLGFRNSNAYHAGFQVTYMEKFHLGYTYSHDLQLADAGAAKGHEVFLYYALSKIAD